MLSANFRPYYREQLEPNMSFLKENIYALIPSGSALQEFTETTTNIKQILHTGAIINLLDLPENFKQLVRLKVGVDKNAYRHFAFLCSAKTKILIARGLSIDSDDDAHWFTLVYAFFLNEWFNQQDLSRIVIYAKNTFDPIHLLFHPEAKGWEIINSKNVKMILDRSDVGNGYEERYLLANRMIQNLHFRGSNTNFYPALKFHPFLNDACVFELISKFIHLTDKESINKTSALIALYMDIEDIKIASSLIN